MNSVSDIDYQHAKNVWNEFGCKTLGDYHDIYLVLDTLLLADCFENFCQVIYDKYKLDPCHFYSIASLAWCAVQKITGFELELFTNIDHYNFIDSSIRGGMSVVSKRYSKANNKYLEDYDPNKESVYLSYLDVNNLYGHAMNSLLPKSNFEFIEDNEYRKLDWANIDTESDTGYILEVDLKYPQELHNLHNDMPLAPVKRKVLNSELGKYQSDLLEQMSDRGYKRIPTEKLLTTLEPKNKYILHFKNLKLYLKLGMKLKNIHRVLKFKQSRYLKKYIELNMKFRKNSKNTFESNLFKLLNNVIFGKSLQDQRKLMLIKMFLNEKQFKKYFIKQILFHF